MEHRSGLIVKATVTPADGHGERDAALAMIGELRGRQRITVAADKGYDTRDFVATAARDARHAACRAVHASVHRGSAIDRAHDAARRLRHQSTETEARRTRLRLDEDRRRAAQAAPSRRRRWSTWVFTFTAAAYNIVRLRRLLPATA